MYHNSPKRFKIGEADWVLIFRPLVLHKGATADPYILNVIGATDIVSLASPRCNVIFVLGPYAGN